MSISISLWGHLAWSPEAVSQVSEPVCRRLSALHRALLVLSRGRQRLRAGRLLSAREGPLRSGHGAGCHRGEILTVSAASFRSCSSGFLRSSSSPSCPSASFSLPREERMWSSPPLRRPRGPSPNPDPCCVSLGSLLSSLCHVSFGCFLSLADHKAMTVVYKQNLLSAATSSHPLSADASFLWCRESAPSGEDRMPQPSSASGQQSFKSSSFLLSASKANCRSSRFLPSSLPDPQQLSFDFQSLNSSADASFNKSLNASPFYPGKTTFGGASAHRRPRFQPGSASQVRPFPLRFCLSSNPCSF